MHRSSPKNSKHFSCKLVQTINLCLFYHDLFYVFKSENKLLPLTKYFEAQHKNIIYTKTSVINGKPVYWTVLGMVGAMVFHFQGSKPVFETICFWLNTS